MASTSTSLSSSASPSESAPKPQTQIYRGELFIAIALALVLLVLRGYYLYSQPWNSDEPQHLHVVWSWATGRLQYRDVFDNHSPLFHALYAPLFSWLGERADIVRPMRLGMLPLFLLSLWATYRLGVTHFSKRAGFWAMLLLAACPPFFFKMGEFRTDVLWTTTWLLTLVALTGGPLTRKRCFWTGLLMGVCFGVSMKATLLLGLLALAALGTLVASWISGASQPTISKKEFGIRLLCGLGGMLIVPAIIVGYFAAHGALQEMYYCVILHSSEGGKHTLGRILSHTFLAPVALWVVVAFLVSWGSFPFLRSQPELGRKRLFFWLTCFLFCPLLVGVWLTATSQGFLPWYPLIAVTLAPLLLKVADRIPRLPLLALLLAASVACTIAVTNPLQTSKTDNHVAMIREAIDLTEPNEYVLDAKGEMIYRDRAFHYVFETFTRRKLEKGKLDGDLVKNLVDTRTAVVKNSNRMSPEWVDFVNANYISVGELEVLGKAITLDAEGNGSFNVVIPERYTILPPDGGAPTSILLDGTPLEGSRSLSAGDHQLKMTPAASGTTYLFWARAAEKGYSPKPPEPRMVKAKDPKKGFIDHLRVFIN